MTSVTEYHIFEFGYKELKNSIHFVLIVKPSTLYWLIFRLVYWLLCHLCSATEPFSSSAVNLPSVFEFLLGYSDLSSMPNLHPPRRHRDLHSTTVLKALSMLLQASSKHVLRVDQGFISKTGYFILQLFLLCDFTLPSSSSGPFSWFYLQNQILMYLTVAWFW